MAYKTLLEQMIDCHIDFVLLIFVCGDISVQYVLDVTRGEDWHKMNPTFLIQLS